MVSCTAAFNKVFLSLLKDLRQNTELKKILSKAYPAFDHSSDAYLKAFSEGCANALFENLCDDFSTVPAVQDLVIATGVTVAKAFDVTADEKDVLNKYIHTLLLIWMVSERSEPELHVVLSKLKDIEGNPATDLSDVFDDDVSKLLQMIASRTTTSGIPGLEEFIDGNPDDLMSALSNTKIGHMAQEIAQDLASATEADTKDVAKMIGKVTEKIGSKLQSGEITQQDLMAEALQMMTKFKPSSSLINNMQSMFKNVQNMKQTMSNPKRDGSTRDRLKLKLEQRSHK